MKLGLIIGLCLFSRAVFADGLPVITVSPASQTVLPGNTATLTVTATGATSFQWRFNGADISGATASTLQIPNAQANNSGYYNVVAENATGWVPSQMAWLSVVFTQGGVFPVYSGKVPFSNRGNTYFQGQVCDASGNPLNNGSAQVVAGPALDQMQPAGQSFTVANGYYGSPSATQTVPTVAPGQNVYYSVVVTYTNSGYGYRQPSTVLNLVAGGGSFPTPSAYGLKFPAWPEWPEPVFLWTDYDSTTTSSPTNQVRIPSENVCLTNVFWGFGDFGVPTWQWRKDGNNIGSPQYFTGNFMSQSGIAILTITNVQPADAGIYDVIVIGNDWIVGPKTVLSILITNGCGVFQSPQFRGTNFVCNLLGAAGRNYTIQWSSNLFNWNDLNTVSNVTGTIPFTNTPALGGARFYRAKLQP
jgi:hypothetical protein